MFECSGQENARGAFTGIRRLLGPGRLVIFTGAVGIGKSALAQNIASEAARAGQPVLFVTLEQNKERVFERIIAMRSGVSLSSLQRGELTAEQRDGVESALQGLKADPLLLLEGAWSTPEIAGCIETQQRLGGRLFDRHLLVIVDCLSPLRERWCLEELAVCRARIASELKAMAVRLNVGILAVVGAVPSANKGQKRKLPRGTPGVVAAANSVFMLKPCGTARPGSIPMTLHLVKRGGAAAPDEIPLVFTPATMRFEEVASHDALVPGAIA